MFPPASLGFLSLYDTYSQFFNCRMQPSMSAPSIFILMSLPMLRHAMAVADLSETSKAYSTSHLPPTTEANPQPNPRPPFSIDYPQTQTRLVFSTEWPTERRLMPEQGLFYFLYSYEYVLIANMSNPHTSEESLYPFEYYEFEIEMNSFGMLYAVGEPDNRPKYQDLLVAVRAIRQVIGSFCLQRGARKYYKEVDVNLYRLGEPFDPHKPLAIMNLFYADQPYPPEDGGQRQSFNLSNPLVGANTLQQR